MSAFLRTRNWKQWTLAALWLAMVALMAGIDLAEGKTLAAIVSAVIYLGLFVICARLGYLQTKRMAP